MKWPQNKPRQTKTTKDLKVNSNHLISHLGFLSLQDPLPSSACLGEQVQGSSVPPRPTFSVLSYGDCLIMQSSFVSVSQSSSRRHHFIFKFGFVWFWRQDFLQLWSLSLPPSAKIKGMRHPTPLCSWRQALTTLFQAGLALRDTPTSACLPSARIKGAHNHTWLISKLMLGPFCLPPLVTIFHIAAATSHPLAFHPGITT